MGVEWVARDAFYRALQGVGSEDPAQAEENAILKKVLAGEVVLMLQAKATQDVRTAIYLKEEFGIPRVILDHAVECWREPELLVRSGAAVVLPPFVPGGRHMDGYVSDSYFLPLDAAKQLSDLGVLFALSAHGGREIGTRLADQAGFALRGGLRSMRPWPRSRSRRRRSPVSPTASDRSRSARTPTWSCGTASLSSPPRA